MAAESLTLSASFETATEADWLNSVSKALKGGGIERITRQTRDGIAIHPLYRETDFSSGQDLRGMPGQAPFLRGGAAEPDPFLPWDIRQRFTHPDPNQTQAEILRDLERGVSGIELALDCSGKNGIQLCSLTDIETALAGVRPDIATIALDPCGAGTGASVAGLLALWAQAQDNSNAAKLVFNIDPLGTLARTGKLSRSLGDSFGQLSALLPVLQARFPEALVLRADGRILHEAGATEAQELAGLIASAVETLRALQAAGVPVETAAATLQFTLSVDGNYGVGIAKLRAARRLWAQVQETLNLPHQPMRLQAVTSRRMLTRYDAWVNILRGTAACFAGAVGGADSVTVRPFNEALGQPEELGRRIARNTQIMAMEESGLGRVADPSGGAWFSERLAEELAHAAWRDFQTIESEGGYGASLLSGALQARIAEARLALLKSIAHRKTPLTGVSEFPLLDEITAPIAPPAALQVKDGVDPAGLRALLSDLPEPIEPGVSTEKLSPLRLSEAFETLRDKAEAYYQAKGERPTIFLAPLGPLAEHTARADFARNLFASGGVEAKTAPVLPKDLVELTAAYRASNCQIAVLCGSDKRYEAEAARAAEALKVAGVRTLWLAGKVDVAGVDRQIFMGCDVVHELTLALTEFGWT